MIQQALQHKVRFQIWSFVYVHGRRQVQRSEDQKANLTTKIVPIHLVDRGVIRAGMEVYKDDQKAGWVTSGTMVPYYDYEGEGENTKLLETTGKRSIGFACIEGNPQIGDIVYVDVRGKKLKAEVVAKHMIQNDPPYGKAVIVK